MISENREVCLVLQASLEQNQPRLCQKGQELFNIFHLKCERLGQRIKRFCISYRKYNLNKDKDSLLSFYDKKQTFVYIILFYIKNKVKNKIYIAKAILIIKKQQYYFVINKICFRHQMTFANYSQRISYNQELKQYLTKTNEDYQLGLNKSHKQSPQYKSAFWLRSTQYRYEKCPSNQTRNSNKRVKKIPLENKIQLTAGNYYGVKLKPLENFYNICLQSALYILQYAIKECSICHNKLGQSYFSIKNCYVNQENKIIMNSHNSLVNAYIPSSDQTIVVRDIVQSIHKICASKCFDDFYSYYKRSSLKSKCDFKYTQSLIKSYCKCSKIQVADYVKVDNSNQYGVKNIRAQHPKSAQRISPFNILKNGIYRKNSASKSHRQSFYTNFFNRSKQKQQINKRAYKNKQTCSSENVIKIQQRANILDNTLPQSQRSKNSQIKKSTTISATTSFKSQLQYGDLLQTSKIKINLCKNLGFSNRTIQNKQYFAFLPNDLDQVQSLGSLSDHQSQLSTRRFQTPVDIMEQNIKKQNQEKILTMNNWTRKINALISEERDLKLSINEVNSNKQNLQRKQNINKIAQINVGVFPVISTHYS